MAQAPHPYFAVWATDRADALERRTRVREEHRRRLRDAHECGVLVLHGGPTLEAQDQHMNGTLLIVQAATLQAVQQFIEGDPYVREGVYDSVVIRPWAWGLGRPPA
ncbi:YciI family protein [Azohydromonas lata]|uniref:YciI family protein n=1 Tax=Azohydromonas lata TaxID=45677 RepID=UPI0008313C37|nr:YciI family protein [Azohydromonas lata]